ncbi:MAG: rhodanese-like domain-containing protein [Lentisphaerae bacterium]|nr:rhodanese-like domain-containing protein [Lentisphaerota bacterium]
MGDMVPRMSGASSGGAPGVAADDLHARIEAGSAPLVLDVRSPDEFAAGHIVGALNIPHDTIAARLADLGPDPRREIVVCCAMGGRAAHAAGELRRAGFTDVKLLDGHMRGWCSSGRRVHR